MRPAFGEGVKRIAPHPSPITVNGKLFAALRASKKHFPHNITPFLLNIDFQLAFRE